MLSDIKLKLILHSYLFRMYLVTNHQETFVKYSMLASLSQSLLKKFMLINMATKGYYYLQILKI